MKKCKIYDITNRIDMDELEKKYSKNYIKKIKSILDEAIKNYKGTKENEILSGDCCPICGSIEYYQSGTCKTCRVCAYAGSCG